MRSANASAVAEPARPLLDAPRSTLARIYASGGPVAPADIAGFAFRGVSLGLPTLIDRLLWKTFAKVFVDVGGTVRGFNLRIEQRGLEVPFVPRRGRRARFGELVARADDAGRTVLDYGLANPRWHPMAPVRDTLVAIADGALLGRMQISVAGRSIETPSFFVLTRARTVPDDVDFADLHRALRAI